MKPNDFQQGQRCPYCKRSKGEERIENWLKNNNYEYIIHKKFKDCKYKKELEFDFQIFINDSFILLEYDGIQHFKNTFNKSNEEFDLQKKRDIIKNKYCKENNINLIRIKYTDYQNLENILNEKLSVYYINDRNSVNK